MKKRELIITCISAFFLILINTGSLSAGDPGTSVTVPQVSFNGRVTDFQTGESLVGAEVQIPNTPFKTYTDLDGNFSFFSNLSL